MRGGIRFKLTLAARAVLWTKYLAVSRDEFSVSRKIGEPSEACCQQQGGDIQS